jgi:hypothetical protein
MTLPRKKILVTGSLDVAGRGKTRARRLDARSFAKIRVLALSLFLGGFCVYPISSGLPLLPQKPASELPFGGRIVPSFCLDRLPDAELLKMINLPLPDHYPSAPPDIRPFHPLQTLMPYLVALDNRALQGKIVKDVDGPALAALLDWLESSRNLIRRDGMAVLEYPVGTEQIPAPFISSMTQAGLTYLASAGYALTGKKKYLDLAREALTAFQLDYRKGGVKVRDEAYGGHDWYEEYATPALEPKNLLFVLNGFLYALHTLAKTLELNIPEQRPVLSAIYEEGLRALRAALPAYETSWGWSLYDRLGNNRASANYHMYQTLLLREIAEREQDANLRKTAERWWSFYKEKMPFYLFPSVHKKQSQLQYLHLKGVYPHFYNRDEYITTLVCRSSSGEKTVVRPDVRAAFISPSGMIQDTQNMEQALLPADTKNMDIWWYDRTEILGLPNLYRMDTLSSAPVSFFSEKKVGQWIDCSRVNSPPEDLSAGETNIPGIVVGTIEDKVPGQPWQKWTHHCVLLFPQILPSRLQIRPAKNQVRTTFRGEPTGLEPGEGWHLFKILSSEGLAGYQANQIALIVQGLHIDPTAYPLIEIPLLMKGGTSMTVDGISPDGSSISRYTLIDGSRNDIQSVLMNWESFPGYQKKLISTLDLRINLGEGEQGGAIALGPITLISGVEGLLTNLDFVEKEPGIYETSLNKNFRLGFPSVFYKIVSAAVR